VQLRLQVVTRPSSPLLGWRLWTRRSCRPSSASIVGHFCYVCYSSHRSGTPSCWTTVVPFVQPTAVWP